MAKVSFTTKGGKRVSFNTKKKSNKSRPPKRRKSNKRKTPKKTNKQRSRSTRSNMPRKKRKSSGRSRGKTSFIDKIPILKNKTVQKVGFGLGMGVVVTQIIDLASRFGPPAIAQPLQQNKAIIKVATEFATEPISAIVDIALNPQMLQSITSRIGGGGGGGNGMSTNQNMVGFA